MVDARFVGSLKEFARRFAFEGPPLAVSLFVAEALFKFHSFTLETIAFLGFWAGARYVYRRLARNFMRVPA